MKKEDLRIVYLGTPDFAVESLRRLVDGGYNIVGVVTTPDKPVGRHQNHLQPSPVKQYALDKGLPLLQPSKLKDPDFLEALKTLRADLQIVVAFRMLPESVWAMPRLGTFNLHASLLPQYRGAAPINWAIINGETETGVTTFFLDQNIDTGEIIDQIHIPIASDETFGSLHDRLMFLGSDLIVQTVDNIIKGTLKSHPQPLTKDILKPAPKIFRENCKIDWSWDLSRIHNFIRGLSPIPTAWSMLETAHGPLQLKIFSATPEPCEHQHPAGTIITDGRTFMKVAVSGGFICINDLQLAGKKRMSVTEFLRGFQCPSSFSVS